MEDSRVLTRDDADISPNSCPISPHTIFSLKYSDLPSSRYSYFLQAFTDESDFEEFKKDLRNFQKLKRNCSNLNNNNNATNLAQCKLEDSDVELNEDLEIICRQNTARKTRRKTHVRTSLNEEETRRNCIQKPTTPYRSSDSELDRNHLKPSCLVQTNNELPAQPRRSPNLNTNTTNCDRFRPESFGLRGDFDRRSYVFGYERRSGLRSSINDILMEFINGDEHFREFERVFETVNNRRNTRDRNGSFSRRMSSYRDDKKGPSSPDSQNSDEKAEEDNGEASSSISYIDDTFADFFDNDEDFLAFEKELEKFRAGRLSRYYGSISSMGSSKDIFSDVKSYCNRSLNRLNSGSMLSVNSCASSGEATPTCSADDHEETEVHWKSVEEWEKMFKKMRRNSRLLSDTKYHNHKRGHHRHSLYGLTKSQPGSEQYQKTQSLSDIPGTCADSVPDRNPAHDQRETSRITAAHASSVGKIPGLSASTDDRLTRQASAEDSTDSDANSCDIWSDSYVDDRDNQYSSSSTLCSSHGDISFSPSSSFSSDLHINEDTDEDLTFSSSPASKQRSQSLQALNRTPQNADVMTLSGSLKKWFNRGRDPTILSELPTSSQSQPSFQALLPSCQLCQDDVLSHRCSSDNDPSQQPPSKQTSNPAGRVEFLVGSERDDDKWETESSHQSYTSSSSSLHLTDDQGDAADDESDQFHSAKSDFSEHFHTAKSDLPSHRRLSGYLCDRQLSAGQRSQSVDLSGLGSLDKADSRGSRVDAWLTSDSDPAGQRHDCQYTCHQLCVPSVNLNCSIISDDGADVSHAHAQPPERRGSLETSLSYGPHARPGAARAMIARGASEDGTSSTFAGQHRTCESVPDLQQITWTAGERTMPTSQPIIESLANALGYDTVDPSELPKLPPPPSAIDELTVDNDDSRFITHGQNQQQHRHSLSHPPGHPPILEDRQRESRDDIAIRVSGGSHLTSSTAAAATTSLTQCEPSPLSTTLASTTASQPPPPPPSSSAAATSTISSSSSSSSPPQGEEVTESGGDSSSGQTHIAGQELVRPEIVEARAEEKDETDSGYRSGTIPDDKLPKVPSQATLDRQDLKRKITKYNHFVPTVHLEMTDKESFQGFLKVCMNLIRPITMELGARPPSIYELLTKEHIIEENTQQVAFYMPRDTYKSLHVSSETTTKELVSLLLKKFHILDHPRKFAMYEQEFSDNNKLVRLRRLGDKDHPLRASLAWNPERFHNYRMVLQENETGEIVWDAFSLPELNNFLKVLDREEKETIMELKHKYAYMRQLMEKRLVEFRGGKRHSKVKTSSQA